MPDFKRGDFFCLENPTGFTGKSITVVQKYRTVCIPSQANHCGFFLDENTIFESMWRVQKANVWEAHSGKDFLVGRWKGMTDEKFNTAWGEVKGLEGKLYPIPRLFMFVLTPIMVQLITPMKWIGLGYFSPLVCSETLGLLLRRAGFIKQHLGLTPAHIANMIRRDKDIDIVFEKAPLFADHEINFMKRIQDND